MFLILWDKLPELELMRRIHIFFIFAVCQIDFQRLAVIPAPIVTHNLQKPGLPSPSPQPALDVTFF